MRRWLAVFLLLALGFAARPSAAKDIVIAEPVHGAGFLPVYVAKDKGYFKDEGLDVTLDTMDGGAMIPAVVSGQAFALTASVDRNAMAKVGGKDVKAVVNLDERANIYLMARKDLMPVTTDLATFLKGKRIAVGVYGGTPNSMLRYLLATKWHLTPGQDVTIVETTSSPLILAAVAAKQADLGVNSEPFIMQGIHQGVWGEPIYAAKDLGIYADTALSVRGDTIRDDPETVHGFVRAMVRALVYANTHRDEMLDFAKKEFPTAPPDGLTASLDRIYKDHIYSTDGYIPPEAWALGNAVVKEGGVLKEDVPYDQVVDMRFVDQVRKELKLD
ncbi:MAG TPA: ABC transporter substrate-binding protein [Stellaceae bacterium]